MIYGNATGGFGMPKTIELSDVDGNTVVGVITGSKVIFTANPSDVKIGKVAASDVGIIEGTDTKTYRTFHATKLVFPEENFSIPLEEYDQFNYTKFQAAIAEFNNDQYDSVSVNKISLNDAVYNVGSSEKLSDVTKNSSSKSIDLNITNSTDKVFIIHYNTYKEE